MSDSIISKINVHVLQMTPHQRSGETAHLLLDARINIESLELIVEEGLRILPMSDAWLEWQRRARAYLHAGEKI